MLANFESNGDPKYKITTEDARLIRAYQVMKAFNCLDINVYRNNPAWFNDAAYALLQTENQAQSDKIEEQQNGRAGT